MLDNLPSFMMCAGATLPKRDSTDTRIIYQTQHKIASGTGLFGKAGIIDSQTAVGSWATYKTGTEQAIINIKCSTQIQIVYG